MDNTTTSKQLIVKDKKRFRQRIVICGSMSFYGDMLDIQRILQEKGIPSIVPEAEDQYISTLSEEDFMAFKRKVSFKYLKKIRAIETVAVIAVNRDKHGIQDYIGPNTFAEIAVAFAQGKKIFLLQGIPEMYIDELQAWHVIPLDGSLLRLLKYYRTATVSFATQLNLFEDI